MILRILKVLVYALVFGTNLLTRFVRVKPGRVVFISYFTNNPEDNFKMIVDKLKESPQFEVVLLLINYRQVSKMAYLLNIIKQAYYFNTAEVVFLDGNNVVMKTIIKKKRTKVIQIWHAVAALKKFGEDTKSRLYNIRSCDYAITSCEKVRPIYSQALRIPEDRVLALGSPRTDDMFSAEKLAESRQRLFSKYDITADKQLVLYAPTFRGSGIDDVALPDIDIAEFSNRLNENHILAVRLHPLIKGFNAPAGVIDLTSEKLLDTLSASDILITDYSTIMFDYALLERPMVFFAPDLDTYEVDRGFYMNYEEFVPGAVARNLDELVNAVKDPADFMDRIKEVKDEYFDFQDGLSTERVAHFVSLLCTYNVSEAIEKKDSNFSA